MNANGFFRVECGEKVTATSINKPYPAIYCFARKARKELPIEKDTSPRPNVEAYIMNSQHILQEIEARLEVAWAKSRRVINQGKHLRGIRVIAPSEVYQFSDPILISSTLHQQSISEQIQQIGLSNPLILLKDP